MMKQIDVLVGAKPIYKGNRPMYATGGATYGNEVTYKDISNREVNAIPNVGLSIGTGALTGAALGTTIFPGVGTAVGAVVGSIAGFIGGLFGNRKRKKQQAEIKEAGRQQTVATMNSRIATDANYLEGSEAGGYTESNGYYLKYGGRIRKANGGLVPNSNNTQVAYGATHNQFNTQTGETGVPYGSVEIEGGGDVNGRLLPGEVVQETQDGSNIFSDRLKLPGSKYTFADGAKMISDKKGSLDRSITKLEKHIDHHLEKLNNPGLSTAKRGTLERNIEKAVIKLNEKTGKANEADVALQGLFNMQETEAAMKGYRDGIATQMACGGRVKMEVGGLAEGYNTVWNPQPTVGSLKGTMVRPQQALGSTSNGIFGGLNSLQSSMAVNTGLNILNALSVGEAINYESKIPLPKQRTITAPRYDARFNVTPYIGQIDRASRTAQRYIDANTSNPQIRRNLNSQVALNAAEQRNMVYMQQQQQEDQLRAQNIDSQYQATMYNNGVTYENAMNAYNRNVALNSARSANRTQMLQGIANSIGDYQDYQMQKYVIDATDLTQVSQSDINRNRATLNNVFKSVFGRKV